MVSLSCEEMKQIIRNAEEQLEQVIDPCEREHLKGFICGIWCCIND
jgi:hypothetical protein